MKNRILTFVLGAAALAAPALAQTAPWPASSPIEKELAARASNVTEVTLDKDRLKFAAKFMGRRDTSDAGLQQLIEGLDGIYVRDYEFDKAGQFSGEEVEQLRKSFETGAWSPLVRDRDRKSGESTDVMVKLVNGKQCGMFILDVEPKEISIVQILGHVNMEDLGKLKGIGGLGALGEGEKNAQAKGAKGEK